jgi:ubiquinol-cytochrome c reductase iron-sulfur subunit
VRFLRALIAWLALRWIGRTRQRHREEELEQRIVAPNEPAPRAETTVILLLLATALAAALFIVLYAIQASTQLLGLALGGTLALLAAGLVLLSKRVLVTEFNPEAYPEPDEDEADAVVQIVRESGDGLTRKGMLIAAGGAAGCALGAAAVVPALSLGPFLDTDPLKVTPWKRGRLLVDEHNHPLVADDIEVGTFYTAFPAGASKELLASPVVVVRLPVADLRLPPERRTWAPEGILAFSKICTHAGCAIALYRYPTFGPTQPKPALVCPCHYSTFDPARAAKVVYGPAGRPLPQLPLMIAEERRLRAAGDYSENVGPGWAAARRRPI